MNRGDAARIIDLIDARIRRGTRSAAMVETTWGEVAATFSTPKTVDVLLYGSATASEGFRVIGGGLPTVGSMVKVAIDKRTGDRWIVEPIFAVGGSTAGSDTLAHDDLIDITSDQHHAEDHNTRHHNGGADEIVTESLGTAETDTGKRLAPNGTGGVAWSTGGTADHGGLTGLSDDDHPQYATNTEFDDHDARHANGGADELAIETLPTAETDTDLVLKPDGTGGVEFATASGGSSPFDLNYIIDGGAATITTGIRPVVRLPWDCTVTAARAYADQNGSIQIDVLRTTHALYDMPSTHPVAGDSIIGAGTDITISSDDKVEYTTPDWDDETLQAGDLLAFNVISATTIRKVTIVLTLTP